MMSSRCYFYSNNIAIKVQNIDGDLPLDYVRCNSQCIFTSHKGVCEYADLARLIDFKQ
jgi:hypothetical protein